MRTYLVEGVSCAGRTSVATELERRGHHVVHGVRVLAHQGDPVTGTPLPGGRHGTPVDAARPLDEVVEDVLRRTGQAQAK